MFHGVATSINFIDTKNRLFEGLHPIESVGRYHSWVVDQNDFPLSLSITALDEQNNIMGLRHNVFDVQGLQFHPESILTACGEKILQNWLLH